MKLKNGIRLVVFLWALCTAVVCQAQVRVFEMLYFEDENGQWRSGLDYNVKPVFPKSNYIVDGKPVRDVEGALGFLYYLRKNGRCPIVAAVNNIRGEVVASFIVERDGTVTNAEIVTSVDRYLDGEVLRLIKAMPKWIPCKYEGKAVRSKVRFRADFVGGGDIYFTVPFYPRHLSLSYEVK